MRRLTLRYDTLAPDVVAAAVREAREVFRDARVRAFVPILVERRARAVLDAASGALAPVPAAEPTSPAADATGCTVVVEVAPTQSWAPGGTATPSPEHGR